MARKLNLVSDEVAGDVAAQVEALRAELADLAASVSSLVTSRSASLRSEIGSRVSESAGRAAAHASDLREASLEGLGAASERAREASLHMVDMVAAEVKKNPARTLAVTLGIGLILGLLSRSSR